MSQLPDRPAGPGASPERKLTPEQFEAVIRRAAELQARGTEEASPDGGVSQAELIRIGKEIGIAPQYVQRALAETVTRPGAEASLADRVFGGSVVEASRAVPGDVESVRAHLERYMVDREWLAALRRFPDRTVFQRARGFDVAKIIVVVQDAVGGASKQPQVGAGFKLKNAHRVEVAVQPLEEGFSYVTLRVDLRNYRLGFALGGVGGGGSVGLGLGAALAVAVDPAAFLLGLPVIGGAVWGFRFAQLHVLDHAQTHLESLLDCLERGEPLVRTRPGRP